jgi:D-aminopeptidase
VVAATLKPTDAVPLPLAPLARVIQSTSDEAVQVHIGLDAMTFTVPVPPVCGRLADGSLSWMAHWLAACVISARWSLSTRLPRRMTGSGFDAARYSTDPSPCPPLVPTMVSQAASLVADHTHSRAVVTMMRPVPPSGGTVESVTPSVTPQRVIGEGAVDVDVDDPQAPIASVVSTAAMKNGKRGRAHLALVESRQTSAYTYSGTALPADQKGGQAMTRRPTAELASPDGFAFDDQPRIIHQADSILRMNRTLVPLITCTAYLTSMVAAQSPKPRARDLGVPFVGTPGSFNAITDVSGVEVGFSTLISGQGKLVVGRGPVRTGVTAVLPRGKAVTDPVMAGWFSLNGNGEMTGTTWIEESGFLEGPVFITNTHSVGVVRDAAIEWAVRRGTTPQAWSLPVVAETWDGRLNDINGFHVKPQHVVEALESAMAGGVAEGNVGGGTGMVCYGFKCGTGTSSRLLTPEAGAYTLGVLVQANHGGRSQLVVAGVPVGAEIPANPPGRGGQQEPEAGSIIIVVATDAPLLPHQLQRLARRASLGLARTGATSGNGSGDIFIAFSTANPRVAQAEGVVEARMLANERMDPLFAATVQATEEAIINALVAAETMRGADDRTVEALPHDKLKAVLKKYGR